MFAFVNGTIANMNGGYFFCRRGGVVVGASAVQAIDRGSIPLSEVRRVTPKTLKIVCRKETGRFARFVGHLTTSPYLCVASIWRDQTVYLLH